MLFTETPLRGAFVIDLDPHKDERGFFARSWCCREFEDHGLNARLVQCDVSLNTRAGTLRGMHYQASPHEEAKLVRCTNGAIFDAIVDLRRGSPTFARHFAAVLSAENHRALYVPEGFAHGFLTLDDHSEVLYQMTGFYEPSAARGVRWDDPVFGIPWPRPVVVMSARDRAYANLQPGQFATA